MDPLGKIDAPGDLNARIEEAVLPPTELKRRIDAARTLRGLDQKELAKLVHADGLGKHDVGRLERGEIPLTRVLRDSLCRHLDVPAWWFTVETVTLPEEMGETLEHRIARIEAAILGDTDLGYQREAMRDFIEAAAPDEPEREVSEIPPRESGGLPSRAEGGGPPPA